MRICDLVHFSKESYFNGAVQTEWFYDRDRIHAIAEGYVFHGPKYYGVSETDVSLGHHRLIDTASFAKNLTEKMYENKPSNSFLMTIAGYGTGKSHLAVSLGALYSGNPDLVNIVTDNIAKADNEISDYIRKINTRKNLVLVLNGMNNFNLDSEVLKYARLALAQHGIDDSILKHITKSYDIAKRFVERAFSLCKDQFNKSAKKYGLSMNGEDLKVYLINNTEADSTVLDIINEVYSEMNGDSIHWDRGISAGDVLSVLQGELCGPDKPFNKVLILFDEFGRYIEYAAVNPTIAGEASLQQIFEAIQSADGRIIFVGFIQNELDAYLSRIEKTSNIIRYVGRYKGSENLFISSNFETILANLIKKNDEAVHNKMVGNALSRYEHFHANIESSINRWDRSTLKKSVWTNGSLYKTVILEGCFPLHPITVWLLSNMHNWMQQRSAITFASEMVDSISKTDINETWLPYVYPINIIDSSIYNEMLNAEEKGLVQSQFCMLYRDIILKVGNKLNDNELSALKAILVVNIGKLAFLNKDDAITAIRYCSNLKEDDARLALKNLEDLHGVILFDENSNTYDLIAEANGFNEFKRVFSRYRLGVKATIDDCDEDIRKDLSLDKDIETSFAQEHHISSVEWNFARTLVDSTEIDRAFLTSTIHKLNGSNSGETSRGLLVYAYCSCNAQDEVSRLSALYRELQLNYQPVIILFLDDSDEEILEALTIKKAIKQFSVSDNERFQKHISAQFRAQNKKACNKFTTLVAKRELIDASGIRTYNTRLNALCSEKFNAVFSSTPPFMFDGFEKRTTVQAKKYLANICIKLFDRTLMNVQSYQALTQDEKNRVRATLATKSSTSWQVFDDSCSLIEPQNALLKKIYDEVEASLSFDEAHSIQKLFGKYATMPYGMNDNALALFIVYFIAMHGNTVLSYYGQDKLVASHLSDKVFKQSKLQKPDLLKIRIQKNANTSVDIVVQTCNEILANTIIERCDMLGQKLIDLLTQEGVSIENQLLVAQAKMRLDEGQKLKKEIYEKLDKANKFVADTSTFLIIHKFIKVFDHIVDADGLISDGLPFVYSEEYKKAIRITKVNIDRILEQKYLASLKELKCNITQLSQVKSLYKNVSKILRENKYIDLSIETEKRIEELEEELLAKQKYESLIVECEKDLALYADTTNFSAKKCNDIISKMQGWKVFFTGKSDLPLSVSEPLLKSINDSISTLNSRIGEIENLYVQALEEFQNASNASNLRHSEMMLKNLEQLELDDRCVHIITELIADIEAALDFIADMPESIDELDTLLSRIHLLEPESCQIAIGNELGSAKLKLVTEQHSWLQKYVVSAEKNVEEMCASDCSNWLEKTKTPPRFLSSAAIEQYKRATEIVEMQLHNSRVQGVVSLFNNLTDSEKKECLQLIGHDY